MLVLSVRRWVLPWRALALLLLLSGPAQAAVLRKGPYLIYGGQPTAMTVRWQTNATPSVGAVLDWGLTASYELGSRPVSENSAAADEHLFSVTLTSLTPGERYFYRVSVDGVIEQSSFLAAPAPATTAVVCYAYGDTRSNPAYHDTVASHILADVDLAPDRLQTMVLHSGDWVAEGNIEPSWDLEYFDRTRLHAMEMMARLPIIGARGNHESDGSLLKKYWPFAFVEPAGSASYQAFDYGPVHVTVVDQYVDYSSGSTQYDWIVQDLASTAAPWKFVVLHAPPYAAGGSHGDDTTTQTQLVPLFETYGVDVVIAGHNHHYARAVRNNIQYVITGGGGAGLYSVDPNRPYVQCAESVHHFVRFAINGPTLDYTAVRDDGTVMEHLQVRKGVDNVAPQVLAASAPGNPNLLNVVFNEAVEAGNGLHGAENTANFGIAGFAVQSALLDGSSSRVTIGVTPGFAPGARHTLSVRAINDRAPSPNTMPVPQLVDFVFPAAPPPPIVAIEIGDLWRYFKGTVHPGVSWTLPGFDDSSWASGQTGIGYGDADDATVLTDMQNNYLTVYTRRGFSVPDPAAVVELTLYIDYDDGFVAAINGNEVVRRGVPQGQDESTAATSHEAGDPETIDIANRSVLVAGANLISIEVHNTSLGSSDLSLLPRLSMRVAPPPPDGGSALDGGVALDGGQRPDASVLDAVATDRRGDSSGGRDLLARDQATPTDSAARDQQPADVGDAATVSNDGSAITDAGADVREVAQGCACSSTLAASEPGAWCVLFALAWRRRRTTCR